VAANYLPAISVTLPHTHEQKRSASKPAPEDDKDAQGRIIAGKTYPFHLALTNPLYDPIQVRLSVQRMHVSAAPTDGGERARRPPFAVSLPTSAFSIAAFAEAWEYDDDEDMFGLDDDDLGLGRRGGDDAGKKGKTKTVGVLEKRANVTVVGGEVVIGKEARGNVKVCNPLRFSSSQNLIYHMVQFNMLVSYTYRSDDPAPTTADTPSKSKPPEVKTFSFYSVVELGTIIPREEARAEWDG
jgi:dynactin 4